MIYRVYCDGSTRGNGQENAVGAWAYVIVNSEYESMSRADVQAVSGTTNQRMELQAAIEAIKAALPLCEKGDIIQIYTDSAYLHNCYKQKWYENWQKNGWKNAKKQPVANEDLWKELIPYFDTFGIEFYKVKGHTAGTTNHEMWNNYVDELAQNASARKKMEEEKNGNSNH